MANPYLNVLTVGRSRGPSLTNTASYIYGRALHDSYNNRLCKHEKNDILFRRIFLPGDAPDDFFDLQNLCDKMEAAEKRRDARTARHFICSLPNELPPHELSRIVKEYVDANFVACGLCAIAAIHEGRNTTDPSQNNPHVHILVSTRTVGPEGFSKDKDREHNHKKYITLWREQWALVQNQAYERNGLDIQVSLKSLEDQGIHDREPTTYLSQIDWEKELRGERTRAGDEKRAIKKRNEERKRQRSRPHRAETGRSQ